MSDNKSIYILGYSGHAYVVIDSITSKGWTVEGYFEKQEQRNPYNIKYMGDERQTGFENIRSESYVFPAIGDNKIRAGLVTLLEEAGVNQLVVEHKSSVVAQHVQIGVSTIIGPSAVINSKSQIGKGVIINTSSVVEHECVIGDNVHIAPGCVLTGNVEVEDHTFIGSNSVVRNDIKIGSNVIIGAGSVVLNHIPSNQTWAGNPAKRIK